MNLAVHNLTLTAPGRQGKAILQEISFQFQQGQFILVAGRTGSGKSTLLDILAGLTKPSSGTVLIGDRPLWNKAAVDRQASASTGIVFQRPEDQLFARSVREEFAYSLRPLRLSGQEAARRIADSLRAVGLQDSMLDDNPLLLSGGQKRRVALAATLACRPQWLLLDEATAGLDGEATQSVAGFLADWKRETGGGVVLASHDLDTFLPLADRVLLMDQGRITADVSGTELCSRPDLLAAAGLAPPAFMRAAALLADRGLAVPGGRVSPGELAAVIIRHKRTGPHTAADAPKLPAAPPARPTGAPEPFAATPAPAGKGPAAAPVSAQVDGAVQAAAPAPAGQRESPLRQRDPRALWLVYMLVSIGIFIQHNAAGLVLSAAVTGAAVYVSRVPLHKVSRVAKAVAFFLLISAVVSGLRLSFQDSTLPAVGFSAEAALNTAGQLGKLGCAMLLGTVFPLAAGYLRMKQGLAHSLAFLSRFKFPVEALSLSVSLIFRFVPLILSEWNRFSRIARARGKSAAKPGSLRMRDLPAVTVPFLLSLLQLAEQTSMAMEMRGYSSLGRNRTSSVQLEMRDKDFRWIGMGILLFFVFLLVRL